MVSVCLTDNGHGINRPCIENYPRIQTTIPRDTIDLRVDRLPDIISVANGLGLTSGVVDYIDRSTYLDLTSKLTVHHLFEDLKLVQDVGTFQA